MITGLAGTDARLDFDGRYVRLTYSSSSGGWLRRHLGTIGVPVTALAGVHLQPPGRRRDGRLLLNLRPGADPFYELAGQVISADDHPFFVEYAPSEEATAQRAADTLRAAVLDTGVAENRADEFMVEPARPPLVVETRDGQAHFDGTNLVLTWKPQSQAAKGSGTSTVPLAALDGVSWVDGKGTNQDYVWFRAVGEPPGMWPEPWSDPRCLRFTTERAETLIFAVAVATELQRVGHTLTAQPGGGLPHGLSEDAGSSVVLHGLRGQMEFDGSAVSVTSQGIDRTIPLLAIDQAELVEAQGGVGYVRLHLAGATATPPDPALDVNAVLHGNDQAALEFTLRVSRALQGVIRVPDPELVRTSGYRPDIGQALTRASARVNTMVRELIALSAALETGETVLEIEMAIGQNIVVFALTDRNVLMFQPGEAHGEHATIPLDLFTDVRATWNDAHEGRLIWLSNDGDESPFHGVHNPARFQDAFRRLRAEAGQASVPSASVPSASVPSASVPSASVSSAGQAVSGAYAHRLDVADALSRVKSDVTAMGGVLDALLGALDPGEPIKELEVGRYESVQGLVALTDRRFAFSGQDGGLQGLSFTDVEYVGCDYDEDKPGKLTVDDRGYDSIEFAWMRNPKRFKYAFTAMLTCPAEHITVPAGASADDFRRRPDVTAALARSRGGDGLQAHGFLLLGAGLAPGDQIQVLESAVFAGETGILALTGRDILFAGPGGLRRVPLGRLAGAAGYSWSDEDDELELTLAGDRDDLVFRVAGAERFEELIGHSLAARPASPPAGPPGGPAGRADALSNKAENLTRLVELRKAGLLTEDEFHAKRAQLE